MTMNGYFSKEGMKNESKCKKCCITIGAVLHLAFSLIIGGICAAWYANVYMIQQNWEDKDLCSQNNCDDVFYDHLPMYYANSEHGPIYYSDDDKEEAEKYLLVIYENCGVGKDADEDA